MAHIHANNTHKIILLKKRIQYLKVIEIMVRPHILIISFSSRVNPADRADIVIFYDICIVRFNQPY